ncbi:MAG: B12-binding domain-containing radical SAM protein [Treponema sp.]|jgi:radical SAM superfamily enzyme YgiQ (UPF0313 family)|nr:B12-binding domain-containing radical SAM protein [Treponema sp.]
MIPILLAAINAKWIHPSLGLRLLKANLGVYEDQAELWEFALRQPLAEKTEPLLAAAPRILGLSVSIWNHKATVELLETLDRAWNAGIAPRPFIILGGPEAAYLKAPSPLIRHADWVVQGEGEDIFRELCGFLLSLSASPSETSIREGIAALPSVTRICGKFIEAHPVELPSIAAAYRLYTEEDLHRKLTYVESSRGCPWACAFCQSSVSQGVRVFPLDRVLKELKELLDRGARSFKFLDRSFNLDIPRAQRIMEVFLEYLERPEPSSIPGKPLLSPLWVHFEMLPSRFPAELRKLLTRFPPGTLRLEIGIQTFNPTTAALISRPSDPEKELEVLAFLRDKTKAIVHVDLIAGLPGEDLGSFAEGFDRLWAVRPTEIQLGILKCLPGTPITRYNETYRMRYAKDPPYEVLETAALSTRDLDRIKNFARFWELIVNRGAFARLLPGIVPEGEAVFNSFMALSDWLLSRFQRNWGIDRKALGAALEEWVRLRHKRGGLEL